MGSGIKILRQYSDKIKKSQAELKGFTTKVADARRKRNYLIGATVGWALFVAGVNRLPKSNALVNLLWVAPLTTAAFALASKNTLSRYEQQADAKKEVLDTYQTTYDSERKTIFDSVWSGSDKCLTELSECVEANFVSTSERDTVLDNHRLSKAIRAYRSNLRDEEEKRLEHERQSQEDDPNEGYDGWLNSDDFPRFD